MRPSLGGVVVSHSNSKVVPTRGYLCNERKSIPAGSLANNANRWRTGERAPLEGEDDRLVGAELAKLLPFASVQLLADS